MPKNIEHSRYICGFCTELTDPKTYVSFEVLLEYMLHLRENHWEKLTEIQQQECLDIIESSQDEK